MLGERATEPRAVRADSHRLDRSIDRAVQHLRSLRHPEGFWWAELESNVTITAEHVFFRHVMEIFDPTEAKKAATYILSRQRDDGMWSNWTGSDDGDLSTTIEAYLALKMGGVSADGPEMTRAREAILSRGGVEKARVFTKIWLAMMGEWPWKGIPIVPPGLVLLPSWFPISIYSFGCWARQTVAALAVVMTRRPIVPLSEIHRIDELFQNGRENADFRIRDTKRTPLSRTFLGLDHVLRLLERVPWKPFRKRALRKAEQWIVERQEADGSWGGIQPPWVYSLIALRTLGYPLDHPVIEKGISGFYGPKGFAIEEEDTFRLQSCLSPVWDTGLALLALKDAGLRDDDPDVLAAGSWLLDKQILRGGDWQIRCDAEPGGWAFEFANDVYPDTDDTAVVLMALRTSDVDDDARLRSIKLGERWLVAMQSSNGGWGAFDRNNTQAWTRQIPFADFGEMIDPPSADVTAHILEYLGRAGRRTDDPVVRRGLAYLKREQEQDGAWYGRWGVNTIYGTGAVLPALYAVGEDMNAPYVQRAVSWLLDRQNPDGGWGERIEGYHDERWRGRGPSTASQTGWALLALLAAGRAGDAATVRGVDYLITTQAEHGGWEEAAFTGTGFPTDFMIRYHIYRDVFPLMALGRYRAVAEEAS